MIQTVDYADVRFFRMARTLGGVALYWTGVYFVDGLLIDSGPPNMRDEVGRLVRELGVRASATTHHHEDHSGNNALLVEQFGIVPLAHPLGLQPLAEPPPLHLYRKFAWGSPLPSPSRALGSTIETERFAFQVIHTPGHAHDHVVLYEPTRGWLFSGDLYLGSRLRFLRSDEDVFALMDSLRRVIALEPQVLFCQHRGRVDRPVTQLQLKLDSLLEIQGTIERLDAKGLSDAEIARTLPGRDLLWRIGTRGHFSKRNFVRAFLARRRGPAAASSSTSGR